VNRCDVASLQYAALERPHDFERRRVNDKARGSERPGIVQMYISRLSWPIDVPSVSGGRLTPL
jgi:hypothetical protein